MKEGLSVSSGAATPQFPEYVEAAVNEVLVVMKHPTIPHSNHFKSGSFDLAMPKSSMPITNEDVAQNAPITNEQWYKFKQRLGENIIKDLQNKSTWAHAEWIDPRERGSFVTSYSPNFKDALNYAEIDESYAPHQLNMDIHINPNGLAEVLDNYDLGLIYSKKISPDELKLLDSIKFDTVKIPVESQKTANMSLKIARVEKDAKKILTLAATYSKQNPDAPKGQSLLKNGIQTLLPEDSTELYYSYAALNENKHHPALSKRTGTLDLYSNVDFQAQTPEAKNIFVFVKDGKLHATVELRASDGFNVDFIPKGDNLENSLEMIAQNPRAAFELKRLANALEKNMASHIKTTPKQTKVL